MESTKISVGSSRDYENMMAEVKFSSVAGFILSKEPKDRDYMVSIHSFRDDAANNFDYNKNIASEKLLLSDLLAALSEARDRLEDLG